MEAIPAFTLYLYVLVNDCCARATIPTTEEVEVVQIMVQLVDLNAALKARLLRNDLKTT
jgi:hypothetical protein